MMREGYWQQSVIILTVLIWWKRWSFKKIKESLVLDQDRGWEDIVLYNDSHMAIFKLQTNERIRF